MYILLALLLIVFILWILGVWFRSGEDLSVYRRDPAGNTGLRLPKSRQ
jgi:hypothetical protein